MGEARAGREQGPAGILLAEAVGIAGEVPRGARQAPERTDMSEEVVGLKVVAVTVLSPPTADEGIPPIEAVLPAGEEGEGPQEIPAAVVMVVVIVVVAGAVAVGEEVKAQGRRGRGVWPRVERGRGGREEGAAVEVAVVVVVVVVALVAALAVGLVAAAAGRADRTSRLPARANAPLEGISRRRVLVRHRLLLQGSVLFGRSDMGRVAGGSS